MKETATAFSSSYTVGFFGNCTLCTETEAFAIFGLLLLFFSLWKDRWHIFEIRNNDDGSVSLKM